jgi:hypothetical protein
LLHLKVFLKLKNPTKLSLLGKKKQKKTQKTPKKTTKNHKNPLGWYFFLNPGFFQPCLVVHDDDLDDLAVATEEGAQVGLGDAAGQAAQEHLQK